MNAVIDFFTNNIIGKQLETVEVVYKLEGGKLSFKYIPYYWDVNPVTLQKTVSKDQYSPFISKEE